MLAAFRPPAPGSEDFARVVDTWTSLGSCFASSLAVMGTLAFPSNEQNALGAVVAMFQIWASLLLLTLCELYALHELPNTRSRRAFALFLAFAVAYWPKLLFALTLLSLHLLHLTRAVVETIRHAPGPTSITSDDVGA